MLKKSAHALIAVVTALCLTALPAAAQLPSARPESVGFDSARLKKLDDYMAKVVADGRVAGMTTLLARHGKIVQSKIYGQSDLAKGTPMTADTIFRIYSMTKPVTGVAMMMLFEDGKWQMDDPVTKFIPEFKNLRVMTGTDAKGQMITVPVKRPPTMREVMSHTAGFGYGLDSAHAVDRLFQDKNVLPTATQQQMIERMADIPLKFQPGTGWAYSIAVDIQGAIVEKLSGQSLGAFFDQRIFKPLKMTDTSFRIAGREGRLAEVYQGDPASGKLGAPQPGIIRDLLKPEFRENGGGGLFSTTGDYARFAQMLLNKGELDGARLLSPAAVELIATNVVPPEVLKSFTGPQGFSEFVGFGMDVRIVLDPRSAGRMDGKDSYDWGGAAATWFWVDPTNDLIFVGMVQRLGGGVEDLRPMARVLTYQALVNPEK
ncbi:MAG: serine hydrolase domain-containing protein [Pseudomonadota bacterium]